MYDDNITFLEDADYIGDMFWLDREESADFSPFWTEEESVDSFPFGVEEEMDLVSLDRTAALIQEMTDRFKDMHWNADGAIAQLRESAKIIETNLKTFSEAYQQLCDYRRVNEMS